MTDRPGPAVPGLQLELFGAPADTPACPLPRAAPGALSPEGRWSWTRPWLVSPHRARALRELEAVRAHFPELDDARIRVGLTRRRSVLGLASLGDEPAIWIRPRRILRFAIAHELTHLLQARGLVPGGEKTADLFALARSSAYVDVAPFYLRVPAAWRVAGSTGTRDGRLVPGAAGRLHALAREAIAGRTARAALGWFERQAAVRARGGSIVTAGS